MEFVAIAAVGMMLGTASDAFKRARAHATRVPVAISWARDGKRLSPSLPRS